MTQGLRFNLRKPAGKSGNNNWYNTQEGVDKSLVSLEGFHTLIQARSEAGYKRDERLDTFYVLDGEFMLDGCGNLCQRIEKDTYAMGISIPTPGLRCSGCDLEWSIENIEDFVFRKGTENVQLENFVGKKLAEVRDEFRARTDAIYFMHPELLVRADRFIDLSPEYPNPESDWQKDIVKNRDGWVGRDEGIDFNHIIQEGDETYFQVWKAFHKHCNRLDLTKTYGEKFRKVFTDAGFQDPRVLAIPNQYCGCDQCAPWYNINTEHGTLTIGWRKRVINIDCSKTALKNLDELFAGEDVTKGETYIHAWGEEKAIEYLSVIREALSKIDPIFTNPKQTNF